MDGRENFVVSRSQSADHDVFVPDDALRINDHEGARGPNGYPTMLTEDFRDRAMRIGQERKRQIVSIGETKMIGFGAGRNADDFRARRQIAFPIIAERTKLFRAYERFIAGVKQQRDDASQMIG